jgi:hypothetical protein
LHRYKFIWIDLRNQKHNFSRQICCQYFLELSQSLTRSIEVDRVKHRYYEDIFWTIKAVSIKKYALIFQLSYWLIMHSHRKAKINSYVQHQLALFCKVTKAKEKYSFALAGKNKRDQRHSQAYQTFMTFMMNFYWSSQPWSHKNGNRQ